MDSPLTRAEHLEHVKRMEDEHKRISKRLDRVEDDQKQITDLTIAVKEMATSMKDMMEEQRDQGDRLEALESRDGEKWRETTKYVFFTILGAIITFLMDSAGIM